MDKAKYEITYIISPDLSEEDKNKLIERFDNILKNGNANIFSSKDWEKRRFTYEIKGKKQGIYHITNVESDNPTLKEFERLAKFENNILRTMVVRRDDIGKKAEEDKKTAETKKPSTISTNNNK